LRIARRRVARREHARCDESVIEEAIQHRVRHARFLRCRQLSAYREEHAFGEAVIADEGFVRIPADDDFAFHHAADLGLPFVRHC
jgi:hypothetical protein